MPLSREPNKLRSEVEAEKYSEVRKGAKRKAEAGWSSLCFVIQYLRPPSRSGYRGKLLLISRLSIAGGFRLGRVVDFAGLHDIGLFVSLSIAVHVYLDHDLV